MKKRNFLIGKKVIITSPVNSSATIVVSVKDTIIKKANTEFVYVNKEGKFATFAFDAIHGLSEATPVSEKVFSKMKKVYAKRPKFKMPTIKWPKFSVSYS